MLAVETLVAENEDKYYKSCCLKMDKQGASFFAQVTILSGLIILSATMLVVNEECNAQRNWSSLLMVCLGCFLPSPKMK